MADASTQIKVLQWVRENWMAKEFGSSFTARNGSLTSGGEYRFNALSNDGRIAAVITTSSPQMTSGKAGTGKQSKVRSNLYFLILSTAERKLAIFTDCAMHNQFVREQANGRVPRDIELLHVPLPHELQVELKSSQALAADEVSPG